MDSVAVTVPLRPPAKKMKKRKELNALATPRAIFRRSSGKQSSQVCSEVCIFLYIFRLAGETFLKKISINNT
jgi:hypothetical protein